MIEDKSYEDKVKVVRLKSQYYYKELKKICDKGSNFQRNYPVFLRKTVKNCGKKVKICDWKKIKILSVYHINLTLF